jgi:hypothetical protein
MALRSGKLSGTVYYADDVTLFNGYAAIALVVPGQNGEGAVWPRLTVISGYPTTTLPLWTKVPIRDGVFSQNESLWYNSDILPANSRYVAYYYDASGLRVGGPTTLFAVNAASVAPPQDVTIDPSIPSALRTVPEPVEVT